MSTGAEGTRRPSHSPGVRDRGSRARRSPRGTPCLRRGSRVQRSAGDPPHRQRAACRCDELGHRERPRPRRWTSLRPRGVLDEILVGLAHELVAHRSDIGTSHDGPRRQAVRTRSGARPSSCRASTVGAAQGHAAIIADDVLPAGLSCTDVGVRRRIASGVPCPVPRRRDATTPTTRPGRVVDVRGRFTSAPGCDQGCDTNPSGGFRTRNAG